MILPICAESAAKRQPTNQPTFLPYDNFKNISPRKGLPDFKIGTWSARIPAQPRRRCSSLAFPRTGTGGRPEDIPSQPTGVIPPGSLRRQNLAAQSSLIRSRSSSLLGRYVNKAASLPDGLSVRPSSDVVSSYPGHTAASECVAAVAVAAAAAAISLRSDDVALR